MLLVSYVNQTKALDSLNLVKQEPLTGCPRVMEEMEGGGQEEEEEEQ